MPIFVCKRFFLYFYPRLVDYYTQVYRNNLQWDEIPASNCIPFWKFYHIEFRSSAGDKTFVFAPNGGRIEEEMLPMICLFVCLVCVISVDG